MEKNIDYKFDTKLGIFYKNYHGSITLKDIIASWEKTIEQALIPKNTKGFILDYRDASFDLELNEHKGIAAFYKRNLDVFGGFRIAIITEKPSDVVIPMLVEELDDGYHSKPFSSEEAAIKWVLG